MKMTQEERNDRMERLYIAVLGDKESGIKGMRDDFLEMKATLNELKRNSEKINMVIKVMYGVGIFFSAAAMYVIKLYNEIFK